MAHNQGWHNSLIAKLDPITGSSGSFLGIPQTFDDLYIITRNIKCAHATTDRSLKLYFNGDETPSNYTYVRHNQISTINNVDWADTAVIGTALAQDTVSGSYSTIWIPNYTEVKTRQVRIFAAEPFNTTIAAHTNIYQRDYYMRWNDTSPIVQMSFQISIDTFAGLSQIFLYGVSYNRP